MKILFIHQNFPGQFKNLAPALSALGHDVSALRISQHSKSNWKGVKIIPYQLRRGNGQGTHPWVVDFESKIIRAEYCFDAMKKLRATGYIPDLVIAHPGWGESLFVKDVWPRCVVKIYCEYYYHSHESDIDFDPEFPPTEATLLQIKLKNTNMLSHMEFADSAISPTAWQAQKFPQRFREKISTIHDGIDTDLVRPNSSAKLNLQDGTVLKSGDEIITFVNRSLEPYRGFHTFMRSLPAVLKTRPGAQVIIIGAEGISYGAAPKDGGTWKNIFFDEISKKLTRSELERVKFLGSVPYDTFLSVLQVSMVHVYLTYPFVLSWSLLEAMAAGCCVIASDTDPVKEVISHNENGILCDFFGYKALAENIVALICDPNIRKRIAVSARESIKENYDLKTKCLPLQIDWALTQERVTCDFL